MSAEADLIMAGTRTETVRPRATVAAEPEQCRPETLSLDDGLAAEQHLPELPPVEAYEDEPAISDDARRAEQQAENERLQHICDNPLAAIMTVEEMITDCVWISDGSQVGRISSPRSVLSFSDFKNTMAASVVPVHDGRAKQKKKMRAVPCAEVWRRDTNRKTVHTRTFRAGAGVMCADPEGQTALNSWRPITRGPAARDVTPFIAHVGYLIDNPSEREAFLDWLAHIEQKPGVLPHYGWLHIANSTGTGRNWLASVLARTWKGYVAPNMDLPMLLDSQFNGALAGRVLAIVDEVQEAAGENPYRHANKLKSLVNAEFRDVNPKFGRQYREHNACRWLVFSNHDNALPITATDRRWRVIKHTASPRGADYYSTLYGLLEDPAFINAVGVTLASRDISGFSPGERPPMTADKIQAITASKSLLQMDAEELVRHWPADVIANPDITALMGDADKGVTPAMRRALEDAGSHLHGRPVKTLHQGKTRCWILRNISSWQHAWHSDLVTEIQRARPAGLRSAEDVLAAACQEQWEQ